MRQFSEKDIDSLDKIYRLNLINSITGYKSANLIATQSKAGNTNVAIFSSITHLGSDPALLSFVLRPTFHRSQSYQFRYTPTTAVQSLKDTGV